MDFYMIQWFTNSPINVTDNGIITSLSAIQPWKADFSIRSIVGGMIIFSNAFYLYYWYISYFEKIGNAYITCENS